MMFLPSARRSRRLLCALALPAVCALPPLAAASCVPHISGPGRFVHPEKTWLPANARGVLLLYPRDLVLRPQDIVVMSDAQESPRVLVEPVALPEGHILSRYVPPGERLWRAGVRGGFKPGARYTVVYVAREGSPLPRMEFQVGPASFDTGAIRPVLSIDPDLRRLSGAATIDYPSGAELAAQRFTIADTARHAPVAGGLTVLTERVFEGQAPVRRGIGAIDCGQPVPQTLADVRNSDLVWQGCPMPKRVVLRAWLGMLEVDERFVAAPALTVRRSDSSFGVCSIFGRTLGKLQDLFEP